MDFITELFDRRWRIINAHPAWASDKKRDLVSLTLNDLSMFERDYGIDSYLTQRCDQKWEHIRQVFFGDDTPTGWN